MASKEAKGEEAGAGTTPAKAGSSMGDTGKEESGKGEASRGEHGKRGAGKGEPSTAEAEKGEASKTPKRGPPGASSGKEKEETLRKAVIWLLEEKEAGRKVSVRLAADKFSLSKTTLHRFLAKSQSSEAEHEKVEAKGDDGRKLDKLGINFLIGSQRGGPEGRKKQTSGMPSPEHKKRKVPARAASAEPADTVDKEDEDSSAHVEQTVWLQNLGQEIYRMRTAVAQLDERVVALERENSQRGHSPGGEDSYVYKLAHVSNEDFFFLGGRSN
eukprot:CAMPEP_0113956834 /NCGR_PEP_ID=MMETSP0011_2-20120614/2324_1 /TAXON_ID=101924 /ORGANISM="Rhodosorus marinus" /LENGTH=270 /DNA_ID=CAMNT_0000967109 /DNA_START=463 /DNA_END=1274 /DNA_ORIENTATION=- /assembly_acc=CAM_ASM_000156